MARKRGAPKPARVSRLGAADLAKLRSAQAEIRFLRWSMTEVSYRDAMASPVVSVDGVELDQLLHDPRARERWFRFCDVQRLRSADTTEMLGRASWHGLGGRVLVWV